MSRATLSLQIYEHLTKLGFDTKKLDTGEYIFQKYSKKWGHFVDAKLYEVSADDIITVTAVDIKGQSEKNCVSKLTFK